MTVTQFAAAYFITLWVVCGVLFFKAYEVVTPTLRCYIEAIVVGLCYALGSLCISGIAVVAVLIVLGV